MKTADIILITVASFILLMVIAAAVRAEETPAEHYARYAQAIPALPGEPDSPAPVSPPQVGLTTTGEGSPVLMVDVFAAMANDQVKASKWYAKPFVALGEAVKEVPADIQRNPIQWLVAGLATWEAVDGGVSDLWDDLTGSDGDGQPKPQVANATADITIEGDNNQLRDVAQTKDVSIAGDNNVVDFQRSE